MWFIFKRLSLGLFLIALAAAVLLLSDLRSRKGARPVITAEKIFKIAVFQHSSQPVLSDGIKGMLDALSSHGFIDGQQIRLQRFNAEGDMPTSHMIAKDPDRRPF